ncbi:uncharacterized protein NPIL_692631 [Nephila pilipes]|uniref:Uncharacterized protein n=1 Tax=Nephila pilipes TaxID=299642 RepID=A0A8X6MW40_NEPPI|nr:uncharacterized protein NPIL_692631 [Nephila pilipes]
MKIIMSEVGKRNIWKMLFTGKLLKSVIFIVCVACFSWQSADFFQLYFTYPTATNIDLSFPEVLIIPAVTICNSNPVSRWRFCDKNPHLCQKPNNLTEICLKHPYLCKYDISNIVIPKLGYYASYFGKEVKDALMEIYTHDIIKDGALYWSWESPYEVKRRRLIRTPQLIQVRLPTYERARIYEDSRGLHQYSLDNANARCRTMVMWNFFNAAGLRKWISAKTEPNRRMSNDSRLFQF